MSYEPKTEQTKTVYWCAHCGKQSKDRREIRQHCQETAHMGVVQSPEYSKIKNHADDAAVQRLIDRKEKLSDYQLKRLFNLVYEQTEWLE